MLENEIVNLIVYINSDGTILSYNKDNTLNPLFTDLSSWSMLHKIYGLNVMPNSKRKGMRQDENLKYVNYYFKDTNTGINIRLTLEHISKMIKCIVKD